MLNSTQARIVSVKEHSGGVPKVALIPIDSWSEERFELHPIFEPDMTTLDKPSEIILDRLKAGEDLEAVILDVCQAPIQRMLAEAMRRALGFIRESKKPRLTADQMAWIFDIALFDGQTIGQLASRHGISKQAFQQGAEKLRRVLEPAHCQSARPQRSREKMRLRNSRRGKHE